ncbi:MAG: hypothetical protein H0X02_05960, partial [Nitrosomonas sp.]|nr:hypothetical protein [Nitrosomonas sp.]
MQTAPWLEPDDERWLQQLRWNIARDIFIDRWDYLKIGHVFGKKCPLIEEAQWFLATIPDYPGWNA